MRYRRAQHDRMRRPRQGDVVGVAAMPGDEAQVLMTAHRLPDPELHCFPLRRGSMVRTAAYLRQSGASDAARPPPGAADGNCKAIRLLIAKSALVPDCAEVLVDAKPDEHKLGRNARHHNAHDGAEDAGDEKDQADKWIISHRGQRTDDARESEQDRNHNGQPIKDLDHSGRDKSLPLEQITKAEHKASRSPAPPSGWQTAL